MRPMDGPRDGGKPGPRHDGPRSKVDAPQGGRPAPQSHGPEGPRPGAEKKLEDHSRQPGPQHRDGPPRDGEPGRGAI